MKAFVIKNKWGQYRGPVGEGFYNSLLNAVFWPDEKAAHESGYLLNEDSYLLEIEIK